MNRSVFPNNIDTFLEHFDIQANDMSNVKRFQELKLKKVLSPSEQEELQNLTALLREKLFSPEDFNKLQDCITNLETFFRDNVQGFISTKQNEINSYSDNKKSEIDMAKNEAVADMTTKKNEFVAHVDNKTNEVSNKFSDTVSNMDSKKSYFIDYVDTKEDEVRALVQEFDTRTNRYYTSWTATEGQTEFNVFQGSQLLPSEANINVSEEHIDLSVNGVLQTPYVDYITVKSGNYDTIRLITNAAQLIQSGTEIVARWYKNVGKLYFKHASTHGAGSSDPITVTEQMLDSVVREKMNQVNKKITVSDKAPSSPALNDVWIDIS